MFICCRNQFDLFTSENKDNLNFESIYCFCEICKKKYLLKFVCKKCCKKLEKSDFNKCQQIFSQPLRNTIHIKDIEKKTDLISKKYNTYNNFKKNVLEYIILYKNFYKIFNNILIDNNFDIQKTKKCFIPFFSFGILYLIKDRKKFICENCLYK